LRGGQDVGLNAIELHEIETLCERPSAV
jgi:hypothetical protein